MPIAETSNKPSSTNAGIQHPIPQNVMDVEFKVFGDLTVRQLVYVFFGIGLAYLFYISLPYFWGITFAILSVSTAVAIAFVPYEERGLDKWAISFIRGMFLNTQMIWKKTYSPPEYFLTDYAQIIRNEIVTLTPAKSRNKLEEYLGNLPENMSELDFIEKERMDVLSSTMDTLQQNNPIKKPETVANTLTIPLIATNQQEKPSQLSQQINTPPEEQLDQDLQEVSSPDTQVKTVPAQDSNITKLQSAENTNINTSQTTKTQYVPEKEEFDIKQNKPNISNNQTIKQEDPAEEKKPTLSEIHENEMDSKSEMLEALTGTKVEILSATKIDRPLETLPDELKGEIKIKTTTRLPPTIVAQDIKEIKKQEKDLQKKVQELLDVTKKAKQENDSSSSNTSSYESRVKVFQKKYKELSHEKNTITTEIEKNTARIDQLSENNQKLPLEKLVINLKKQNETLSSNMKELENELFDLKKNQNKNQSEQTIPTEGIPQNKTTNTQGIENPQIIQQTNQAQTQNQAQSTTKNTYENVMASSNSPVSDNQAPIQNTSKINRHKLVYKEGSRPKNTYSANNLKKRKSAIQNNTPQNNQQQQQQQTNDTSNSNDNNHSRHMPHMNFNKKDNKKSVSPDPNGNIISGTIKDKNGELISGSVVLIKDHEGNVIRALKTNKLGQYRIQSPLRNGKYTIEAIKGGEKFDIIQFEATGAIIDPVNIIAIK